MRMTRRNARLFVAALCFLSGLVVLASVPAWAAGAQPSRPDWDKWRLTLDFVVIVAVLANTVYTWIANRSKANKQAIEHVANELHGIRGRVGVLETEVHHLPDHDDLGNLHEKVNQVANGMERVGGELAGMNRTLHLIQESLLAERNGK